MNKNESVPLEMTGDENISEPKSPPKKKIPASKKASRPANKAAPSVKRGAVAARKNSRNRKGGGTEPVATKPKRTFPHYSIEDARQVPDALKQFNMGNPWPPKDIAQALSIGTGNNYFYLTQSARDYGFTVGTRESDKIELTDLGRSLVYPKTPKEGRDAIISAFRNVELFKKVYDYYQGENLPDIQYLKNTLKVEFGVAEDFQDEFYTLYQTNLAYLKTQGADLGDSEDTPLDKPISQAGGNSIILGESKNAGDLIAFVAMPFSERTKDHSPGYFDEVLKHLITPAAVRANFNARTAKKAGSEVIQSTIVNDLDNADLVIVDLTEHNPNVLFELGMRIAFNKPVCLIRARGTAPIFDIDHMLRVYDYNPCLWASTLATDVPLLSEFIAETWKNRETERSYLKILRESK
jgi:hypothetical protein